MHCRTRILFGSIGSIDHGQQFLLEESVIFAFFASFVQLYYNVSDYAKFQVHP